MAEELKEDKLVEQEISKNESYNKSKATLKKTIVPFGISVLIYGIIFLVVAGIATFVIISNPEWWRILIVSLLAALAFVFFLLPFINYRVFIRENKISMKKDFGIFSEDRIQTAQTVELENVISYKVILSERNSDNEPYSGRTAKKKYIEFTLADNSKRRLYVSVLAKKQLVNILKYIREVTNLELTNE